MKKPIIGIIGRSDMSTEEYSIQCCFDSVRNAIIKCGGIPILILPPQAIEYENINPKDVNKLTQDEKNDLISIVNICDGVVMPGTFKLYEYDYFIYEYAKEKDIPILGICGGMQLIGISGRTKEERNSILKLNNTEIIHFKKNKKYVHNVKINKETLLYKIIGKEEIKVNSRHNYHLENIDDFIVNAISTDGLIESIEVPNKKFILGIQWHPESILEDDEDSKKIIKSFIKVSIAQ